jgi:hypothetical protein
MSTHTHRLRRLLFRYRRVLSVVGVLLVFITFVARDGLAERWKDEASAIDLARDVYGIKNDTTEVLRKITALSAMVTDNVRAQDKNLSKGMLLSLSLVDFLNDQRLQGFRIMMDNITALSEKLPRDRSEAEELKAIKAEFQQHWQEFGNLLMPIAKRGIAAEVSDAEQQEIYTKAWPILDQQIHLSFRLDDLFSRVMKRAEERRRQIERNSTIAWWAAAAGYGIGWFLALVGRILNVPIDEAATSSSI